MKNQNLDEEEKKFREILKNEPKNIGASANLGRLLEEKDDTTSAAEVLLESFKLNPYCTFLLREYYRLTKKNLYIPMVIEANPEKFYEYKDYKAVILDIKQEMGKISYKYILFLYQGDVVFPLYYVSLEKNNLFEELGGPPYFLCAFDEENHVNYGGFDEEITIENFANKALEVVAQKYELKMKDFKVV